MRRTSLPRVVLRQLTRASGLALVASACFSEPSHPLAEVQGLSELYEHMGRGRVVRVTGPSLSGKGVALGDGTWILTGAHLVGSATELRVQDVDGREAEGRRVAVDGQRGLALLRLDDMRLEAARLELDAIPVTGDDIYLMVDDTFVGFAPASGSIAARRDVEAGDLLRLSGFVASNEFGGPVFNSAGRVVGLVIPDELVDPTVRASYAQPVPALLTFLRAAGGPQR